VRAARSQKKSQVAGIRAGVHRVTDQERAILVDVWEAAVRATHHFLTESDIQLFKPLVPKGLFSLEHLLCVRDTGGALIGFVGVADGKMEALFVHPAWHGAGIGRRLATHVIDTLGVTTVDVNEQNVQAVAFYRHLGFEVEGRSSVDGLGLPFPLLHMRLP
jgi:putative acetyltransferase